MTNTKGFLPAGKNPGKNDIEAILDEFARETNNDKGTSWEFSCRIDEIFDHTEVETLATLAFTRGKEQGKLEEIEELIKLADERRVNSKFKYEAGRHATVQNWLIEECERLKSQLKGFSCEENPGKEGEVRK